MRDNLKYYRKLNGFTQQEMADKLGISKSYYNEIERGVSNGTVIIFKQIAKIFDIEFDPHNLIE